MIRKDRSTIGQVQYEKRVSTTKAAENSAGKKKTRAARLGDAMRESELRYRCLFESAQEGIMIVNAATGRVEDANPYLLDLLGYTREEIVKKRIWQLYADAKAAKQAFETLQKKKYLRMDNLPMQAKDGRLAPAESVSNVYRVGKSKVIQFNIRDIAEQKRVEEALREDERRLESLFDNSPIPIWEEDFSEVKNYLKKIKLAGKSDEAVRKYTARHPDLIGQSVARVRIINVNRACLTLHNATDKASLLKGLGALVTEDSRKALLEQIAAIACGKTQMEKDSMVRTLDGELRHVHVRWSVVPGYEESLERVIVSTEDISQRIEAEGALKASERRFRSLIENSQDAIALLDATGKLIYESPSGLRITGYSAAERIGGSGFDLIHPDDLGDVRQNFGRVMQKPGADVRLQVRSRCKDGEWRWLDVTAVNLLADPAVGAIVVNYRDITERRQAEAALAEAQQTQRLLLESVGEGIHGLDTEGRIMFENAASLHMFGWEADEMLGQNAHALIHHHRADGSPYLVEECPIHCTLGDGETRRVENEVFFRKDGTGFPVEYTCAAMKSDGNITGVVVSFRDVTERRQAEKNLRQSESIYRSIARNMPHGTVALFDKELRFLVADGSAMGVAGPPRELVEGRTIWEAFPPEVCQMIEPFYREALAGKETTLEVPFGDFIFESHHAPVKDDKGDVFAGLVVAHDITERKRADENIQRERVFSDAIIKSMPGIFYLFDTQGKFLRWNENFEKVSGYSAAEVAAMHPTDFFDEPEKKLISQRIGQVFETGHSFAEANFVSRDGAHTPFYFTGVRVELNGQTCLLGVGVEITERKRAEKALTDLSRAVNASGDIVFMTDRDGMITSVNSQFSDLYGYSPDELIGKTTPRILKSGKQGPEVYKKFWAMITRGELFRGEVINKAKDGRLIPIEETVSPFFDERGEIAGFLAIQRNITDRGQAEESLRLAEAKYRALVENIPAIVYMDEADETSANIYTSPQIEKILGYTPAMFVDNPTIWHQHIDQRDYPAALAAIRKTLEEGFASQEYRFIARDGRTVWVRDLAVLIRAEDGSPQFIQGFIEDITTQKKAEEKIKAHAADLEKEIAERKHAEAAERDQRVLAESLRETAETLSGSLDYGSVLDRILDIVGRVVPHDSSTILLVENGELRLARSRGYEGREDLLAEDVRLLNLSEPGNLRQMFESKQPVLIPDVKADPLWKRLPGSGWIRSSIGVPMILHDEVIGFVLLDGRTPNMFTQIHAERLQAFSNQAAIAIHNARLYQQAQDEISARRQAEANIQKQIRRLRSLREIDMAIGASFDMQTNLNTLLKHATVELNVDAADILLFNPGLNLLEYATAYGFRGQAIEKSSLRFGEGHAGRVVM